MSTQVRYIAEPKHVREVCLHGTADLAFWMDRLQREHLVPLEHRGRARILISAAAMTFLGVRFTEVNISILVCVPYREDRQEAALLLQGGNSSRLLTWCERRLFATPYRHCRCHVSLDSPAFIGLMERKQTVFEAQMRSAVLSPKQPPGLREYGFEGPVFLPNSGGDDGGVFFARICGRTETYPFVAGQDSVCIVAPPTAGVFQSLLDSHFAGDEWAVRRDATHARSKTYKRAQLLAGRPLE